MTKKRKKKASTLKEEEAKVLAEAQENEAVAFEEIDDADVFTEADLEEANAATPDVEPGDAEAEGPNNPSTNSPEGKGFLYCPVTGDLLATTPSQMVDYENEKEGIHYRGRASKLKVKLAQGAGRVIVV